MRMTTRREIGLGSIVARLGTKRNSRRMMTRSAWVLEWLRKDEREGKRLTCGLLLAAGGGINEEGVRVERLLNWC